MGFAYHRIVLDDEGKPIDYIFLELNEAFEKLTKLDREDILNKKLTEVLPGTENDPADWIGIYGKVAIDGISQSFEQYSRNVNKWFKVYVSSPEPHYFITLFIDITSNKLFNDEAKKFSLAIEQSPVSVVITDLDANIEYANKKFSEITGNSFEEAKGQNPRILQSGLHGKGYYADLWETLAGGKTWKGEFLNKKKNGDFFWENATITPIVDNNGKVTNYVAIMEDITQSKLAEQEISKLSQVLEQSPNMVLLTNANFEIEYVNESFQWVSGYSAEEIKGRLFKLLRLANDNKEEYKEFWDILNAGGYWNGERVDKRKNGELYWQQVFINTITDQNNGEVINYAVTMQDISERKKVEEKLQELNIDLEQKIVDRTSELSLANEFLMNEMIVRKQNEIALKLAKEEAEKANQVKSEFISRMSHELRTPMNSILGFAQLFAMGDITETQRKGVTHILNSGQHLLKLINEVLDISKIESGKLTLSVENINVYECVAEAVDLVTPLTIQSQISIHYPQTPQDSIFVKADKQRLIQVLVNLLNNAVKYNKEGGEVNIKVDYIDKQDEQDAHVLIAIQDTGIGIAVDDLEKLFVPFERAGGTETVVEGTGLGLAITKELLHLLKGEIDVESKLGVGSTFTLKLPGAHNHKPELISVNEIVAPVTNQQTQRNRGSVLYVEDNHINLELVEQVFQTHCPDVELISTKKGKEAVELVLKHRPFLILLDLDLPDIHGSKLVSIFKNNPETAQIPIIVVSADAMPYQIKKMYKLGVSAYLTKPINVHELLFEIDKF